MNRTLVLAAAAAALLSAPLAAAAQGVTAPTIAADAAAGQPVADANVTASQPVANPPPATTERGPGTADTGYAGQLQGPAFLDVFARISADEAKMAGNRRGLSQLRAIKAEATQRRARHGGELRDWDRELINKKLDQVEGAGV